MLFFTFLTLNLAGQNSSVARALAIDAFNNLDYQTSKTMFDMIGSPSKEDLVYLDFIELELTGTNKNMAKLVKSEKKLRETKDKSLALLARYYTLNDNLDKANEIYSFLSDHKEIAAHSLYFLAKNLQTQGIHDDAEEIWANIPRLHSSSPFADASKFELLTLELNQIKQAEGAIVLYNKTNNIALKRKIVLFLNNIYTANNKLSDLENLYANYSIYEGDKSIICYNLAMLYKNEGNHDLFIKNLNECSTLKNKDLREKALFGLALYYFDKKDFETALSYITKDTFNYSIDNVLNKVVLETTLYNKLALYDNTVKLSTYILDKNISDKKFSNMLHYISLQRGNAYSKLGDETNAIGDYSNIIRLDTKSDIAFESAYRTALIYVKRGEASRADKFFSFIENKENLSLLEKQTIYLSKAITTYMATDYKKSISYCITILKQKLLPNLDDVSLLMAANYARLEDYKSAGKIYSSLNFDDNIQKQSDVYYMAALNYFRSKDYENAINFYEKVHGFNLETDGGRSLLFWIARAYGYLEQYASASEYYEKALNVSASSDDVINQPMRSNVSKETILGETVLSHYKSKSLFAKKRLEELNSKNSSLAKSMKYIITEEAITNGDTDMDNLLLTDKDSSKDFDENYKKALTLELRGDTNKSYLQYKSMFFTTNFDTERLILSRKLAKIAPKDEVFKLIEESEANRFNIEIRLPLILSWAISNPSEDSETKIVYLEEIDVNKAAQLEQSNYCYAMGLLLFELKQNEQALAYLENAIALAISPNQYIFSREAISKIYIKERLYADAVKEYFKIATAFSNDEKIASTALFNAYELCMNNNLETQASSIAKKIKTDYPNSDVVEYL